MFADVGFFFFQAEDGIRDLVRSRGLGDVYKRQCDVLPLITFSDVSASGVCPQDYSVTRTWIATDECGNSSSCSATIFVQDNTCLLYTSDAADERSSVDLGGRRIIKKKKNEEKGGDRKIHKNYSITHTYINTQKKTIITTLKAHIKT